MKKPAPIEVRRVQVRELRAGFRALRAEKLPVLVMANSRACAVLLPLPYVYAWSSDDESLCVKELRAAFEAALRELGR